MACPNCGWEVRPLPFGPPIEDPKEVLKRERNYELLQAAATIYAGTDPSRQIDEINDRMETHEMMFAVNRAVAMLAEIERRES